MADANSPSQRRARIRNRNGVRVSRNRNRAAKCEARAESAKSPEREVWCCDENGMLDILDPKQEAYKPVPMTPAELALYHPGSKGDAKWKDGVLELADGFMVCGGTVKPREYPNVKGIDLVRYFTDTYLMNKAESEEARRKRIQTEQNPLQIPNPRTSAPTHSRKHNKPSRRHKRSKHSAFLNLPAEVRNLIYAHAMPNGRILIRGSHPNKEFAALKAAWNPDNSPVLRPSYRLSHLLDNDDIVNGLHISDALLLTCKRIKEEVELFMYAQITFCFDSMKTINKFLDRASKSGITEIRRLELFNAGYGRPLNPSYAQVKDAYDYKWRKTCLRIAQEMPALVSLKLDITIEQRSPILQPEDDWYETLMTLVSKKLLEHVEVNLTCHFADEDNMMELARDLENAMMSETGKHARDEKQANLAIRRYYEARAAAQAAKAERLALLPPVQAKRILTIVLPENGNVRSSVNADKGEKKYYTRNTAGYAREVSLGGWWDNPSLE